jgi:carbon monoxide dehydrogenase subunit G
VWKDYVMKYRNSIEIAQPRDRVAAVLADPAHLPNWLRGMVLHEPIRGEHGQVGTTSRVVLQSGKQTFEIIETITRREPADLTEIPRGAVVHFERESVGGGMQGVVRDRLTEVNPETTLWVSDSEYRFDGLIMRMIGLVMPGTFRKQSQQHMEDFKAFVEHGTDVRARSSD